MSSLTVVIAVYNRCDVLRKALLSVSSQSFVPDELIVSDDGSQEDVQAVVRELLPMLRCAVTYVRQPDRGFRLAKCRNNGIRQASGDVLVFVDQDIVGTKHYLAVFAREVEPRRFVVGYPVRLTEAQTHRLSEETIASGRFDGIVTKRQRNKIRRQFAKDMFYRLGRRHLLLGGSRPKLRGGVFGIRRDDVLRVDGFDENYWGWGNEDDDLGRRLYAAGVVGKNPFFREYPLHLHHPSHHEGGRRLNRAYNLRRMREIREGDVRATRGLSNPLLHERLGVEQLQ